MSPLPLIATVRSDVAALRIWVDRYRCIRRRRRIRSEIVCLQKRTGWNGKTVYSLAHRRAKPVHPNAVSPANTDKVKPSARSRSPVRCTLNGGAAVIGEVFTAILIRR